MTQANWTVSQAVVWIMTRSLSAAAEAPKELVLLHLSEDGNPNLQDAQSDLWKLLTDGKLRAMGINTAGLIVEIPAPMWMYLRGYFDRNEYFSKDGMNGNTDSFTQVKIPQQSLRSLRPDANGAKRGPKPKIDKMKFNKIAWEWIDENGMPNPQLDPNSRQADLERHMAQHFSGAESHIRKLVVTAMQTYTSIGLRGR